MNDALGMRRGERIGQCETDLEKRRNVEPAARNTLVQRFTPGNSMTRNGTSEVPTS